MSINAQTAEQVQQQFVNYLLSLSSAPVTDYNVGSVIRLTEEPQAQALEGLYEANIINTQETIQSMMYQIFQFPPLPAVNAYVLETFTNTTASAVPINAGTLLTISNSTLQYQTQNSFTIPANGSINAMIVCTTPGAAGNAPANSITQLVTPISGVTVTNSQAVITGRDAETADQRAARFYTHLARIHRGDTQALEAGALTSNITDASGYITEQVIKAVASDGGYALVSGAYVAVSGQIAGYATVWGYNGTGAMSSGLLSQTQNIINGYTDAQGVTHTGYKAAGVIATFYDSVRASVSMSVGIYPAPGYTLSMVSGSVTTAIQGVFENIDIGETLLRSDLNYAIRNVPGVLNVEITSPAIDQVGASGQIYVLAGIPTYTDLSA